MNLLRYRGYLAKVEYSAEDDCFVGHIFGINDVIGFHANSVPELHKAFQEAVDNYLATCQKLGHEPQRAYSGNFNVRIDPELHARAAAEAKLRKKSLNAVVAEALKQYVKA